MKYSKQEIIQYAREEDVKFIRLAFCDIFGRQKNISIMPDELERAFEYGIAFDASAVAGFDDGKSGDLLLHPEADTLMPLPWRPEHGRVVQMFSDISYPDGTPFERDTRHLLKQAAERARRAGFEFSFGAEQEFYLFLLDENGNPSRTPCDRAGYMDIAPDDKGENLRREVCLTLEKMGIRPESSHHEEGPGQNEIDFRYSGALKAADDAVTFQRTVKTVAFLSGLYADFSPKPIADQPGNGFHINLSLKPCGEKIFSAMLAGLLRHIREMTLFLNPTPESYQRLGRDKAPSQIGWSASSRCQLLRVPAAQREYQRCELRSPDPCANPYLAFSLMIHAALDGIENGLPLPAPIDSNAGGAPQKSPERLPESLRAARDAAQSDFIKAHVPGAILSAYLAEK